MKTVMGYEQPIVPPPDDYRGNFFLGGWPAVVVGRSCGVCGCGGGGGGGAGMVMPAGWIEWVTDV